MKTGGGGKWEGLGGRGVCSSPLRVFFVERGQGEGVVGARAADWRGRLAWSCSHPAADVLFCRLTGGICLQGPVSCHDGVRGPVLESAAFLVINPGERGEGTLAFPAKRTREGGREWPVFTVPGPLFVVSLRSVAVRPRKADRPDRTMGTRWTVESVIPRSLRTVLSSGVGCLTPLDLTWELRTEVLMEEATVELWKWFYFR